jgi:uncharacterized protein YggU (UPF0235/DUF167 family)
VSALEWLVIFELVVLGLAGILAIAAMFIAKQDPNDPVAVFCATFWREFLHPPQSIPINPARYVQGESGPSGIGLGHPEPTEDDEFYGRIPKAANGRVNKVDLQILVEPNAPADEVVGRDGDGIKCRVSGEVADSQSNKALIEMVAKALGVKPYQVTLTKGHYQPRKAVQVQGLSPADLQAKLEMLPEAE